MINFKVDSERRHILTKTQFFKKLLLTIPREIFLQEHAKEGRRAHESVDRKLGESLKRIYVYNKKPSKGCTRITP